MTTFLARLAAVAVAGGVLCSAAVPAGARTEDTSVRSAPTTRLDVSDLETGEPPALAWSERRAGRTLIHGGGGIGPSAPAPNSLTELAPMGSGFVIQTAGNRPTTTRWIAADGSPGRREWRTGNGLAVSPRGTTVAFSGRAGRVWSIDQEGDRVLRFNPVPIPGKGQAVSVSSDNCREGENGNGCVIVVNGARAWYTSSHGIVDRMPHLRTASAGRGAWLGGITSVSDTGTCSAMLRSSRVQWRTCDNRFSDLSPDRRHVLGLPAYGDGFGPQQLDLLALSDGSVVRSFTPARDGSSATYFEEVWEDAAHVLVVTFQAGKWAVVRLGVDGSMEYAVGPRSGSTDTRPPFQLQTR